MTDLELFFVEPTVLESTEKLSPDRRRTLRQKADVERGIHPLMRTPTVPERGTCGDCVHRVSVGHHDRAFPKCELAGITHGPGTDCRAWWPACTRHEPAP
jgi:hypothetical protein